MSIEVLKCSLIEKEEELNQIRAEFQDYQEMSKTLESELEDEVEELKSVIEKLKQENQELNEKNNELKVVDI